MSNQYGFTKSFYNWCMENHKQSVLSRWDYKLNQCSPKDVGYGTHKKYYFKCPRELHKSELKSLHDFTQGKNCTMDCNACKSFAQWGIDNLGKDFLERYWDFEKNKGIDPWMINCKTNRQCWIKCQEKTYHGSYQKSCKRFLYGERCSYCAGKRVHKFDSLGYLYPQVLDIWSNKNIKSLYEYSPMSSKKVWWKCSDGKHGDYYRQISNSVIYKFRCPECVREMNESILQSKVRLYIESLGCCVLHERNCTLVPKNVKIINTNNTLPFDNELIIRDKHLIIEVNGEQHYKINSYASIWNEKGLTPEQSLHKRQLYDRYKKYVAYCNGYFYIAIPYWADDENKTWKKMIDNKINKILNIQTKAS